MPLGLFTGELTAYFKFGRSKSSGPEKLSELELPKLLSVGLLFGFAAGFMLAVGPALTWGSRDRVLFFCGCLSSAYVSRPGANESFFLSVITVLLFLAPIWATFSPQKISIKACEGLSFSD